MSPPPLELADFSLTDFEHPTGLKEQYCSNQRISLVLQRGRLPMAWSDFRLWDEHGALLLKCVDCFAVFQDHKWIKTRDNDVVYTMISFDGNIAVDIHEGLAPAYGPGRGSEYATCVDSPGPKRDISVDFWDFQSKLVIQWRLIFINDRDHAVLLTPEGAVAKISKGRWWFSPYHIEVGKNVDYSLVMMAVIASCVVGTHGDLLNPTMDQVFTNNIDLMRDNGYEEQLGKREDRTDPEVHNIFIKPHPA
ncbi:hypothetical protein I316_02316 [Kwoniella heveanensis BCC8398]|uniref:Uncharacterized protein n=1 Tax=Kwoniella heveanensis BCC8398 TaxID=1296120 RepID=A0A1B9GXT1_9TREE|nr:hypothetical protein I316_02316 [Kwoniella heveanensis BCC8398]